MTHSLKDNLREFLSDKDSKKPKSYGFNFKLFYKRHFEESANQSQLYAVNIKYYSGGAGYVLSKEAFTRVGQMIKNSSYCVKNGDAEDVGVGECLNKLGVIPNQSIDELERKGFHPLSNFRHFNGDFPNWMYQMAQNPLKNVKDSIF